MNTESKPSKIFISYSHDSEAHTDRVLELADRLRQDGIDANIDQYEQAPSQGWQRWMLNEIEDAQFVLIICTEQYDRRFRGKEEVGKGKGVTWEGTIVTQELYDSQGRNLKFIPVLLNSNDESFVPLPLRSSNIYKLDRENGYQLLYRRLTDQHETPAPPLGNVTKLPVRDRGQSAGENLSPKTKPNSPPGQPSTVNPILNLVMKSKNILRVVVASPSDVQTERDLLDITVIPELNRGIAKAYNLVLELCRWETDAYPGFHLDGPQGLIDGILKIDECDILIGIFWKRFGTPIQSGATGTEHEFLTAYQAWQKKGSPEIMMYFKEKEFTPTERDLEQMQGVFNFKNNLPKEGLYWKFKDERDFESLVRQHLTRVVEKIAAQPHENKLNPIDVQAIPDIETIYQLVEDALTNEDLTKLCQTQFPKVYNLFTGGQTKDQKVGLLVDYTTRQFEIPKLLIAIEKINSNAYARFRDNQSKS
jgi:SEFIR domain/Effector-associated domain 7